MHDLRVILKARAFTAVVTKKEVQVLLSIEDLAGYKILKKIDISTNELPKSGSDKILKKDLRDRFWAGRERAVG